MKRWSYRRLQAGKGKLDDLIYLDNAATTKVKEEVFEAMQPYFTEIYGNPSSICRFAGVGKGAMEAARGTVADFLNAAPKEIYFTGGGSESDNWALKAAAFAKRDVGKHIITSKIEHPAVLRTCEYLEKLGFEVTYIDVDGDGMLRMDCLEAAIRDDTILISVMFANNEIGTIQPIEEIGRVAHDHGIWFHTDAVQAYGHEPIDVEGMHIDLLSASGHKFGGPKGVGILYVRDSVKIGAFIHGGAQERGRRGGTYNTPGIVGFGKATELAKRDLEEHRAYEEELRDYLIERAISEIPYTRLNGHRTKRLSNNVNFSFRFIAGESLLILLDQEKIVASSGSACASGSPDPSHVLLAIGLSHETARGALRLTLSEETTKEELDYVVEALKKNVGRLRSIGSFNGR